VTIDGIEGIVSLAALVRVLALAALQGVAPAPSRELALALATGERVVAPWP
jgi:hypothetical protein